jgi:hypothetical protein
MLSAVAAGWGLGKERHPGFNSWKIKGRAGTLVSPQPSPQLFPFLHRSEDQLSVRIARQSMEQRELFNMQTAAIGCEKLWLSQQHHVLMLLAAHKPQLSPKILSYL